MLVKRTSIIFLTCLVIVWASMVGTAAPATVVRIGVVLPLSGAQELLGKAARQGHDLAAKVWNARGGFKALGGARVELVYADAQSDPKIAASETERLILSEKVVAIMGAFSSALTATSSDVAERYGIPYVNDGAISDTLTKRGFKTFFRPSVNATDIGSTPIRFLKSALRQQVRTIALIYENTDYGTGVAKSVTELAVVAGFKIVLDESYPQRTADLSPLILKIRAAKPDIVIGATYIADALLFQRQLRELGVQVPAWLGTGGAYDLPDFYKDNANAEGVLSATSFSVKLAQRVVPMREFVQLFRGEYGTDPQVNNADGFESSLILFDAISRAASTDPNAIIRALASTDIKLSVKGVPVRFSRSGQNIYSGGVTVVTQIQNGIPEIVWPADKATAKLIFPRR